jgi:peroxiredoxin
MAKKYLILFFLGLTMVACQEKKETGDVGITGTFPALSGETLFLEELEVRNTVLLDSVLLPDGGNFYFQLTIQDAGFYVLRTTKENAIILQVEKGEEVSVFSQHKEFAKGYEVNGSKGSKLYQEFDQFMLGQKTKLDSIAVIYYESRGTENFLATKTRLDSIYLLILQDQKDYVHNFIHNNPNSLVSLIVINRKLGNTQVLDEEKDFPLLHTLDSLLTLSYPENKHVLDNQKRVKEIRLRIFDHYQLERKLLPGNKAPDIVLNDTAGNPHSLKSYLGKKVIVCFWAGWNAKSRQDNNKLVKIYEELKTKNVELIGISLDENKVVWKGAIKLDQLSWLQLSDLGGFLSEIKKTYNVPDDLPFYYLLDEKHVIVGKSKDLADILIAIESDSN